MKAYIALIFCFIGLGVASAQSFDYGNSWYVSDTGRPFIKMMVSKTGVYRVSATTLAQANYDLSNVNPDHLQLMYRGKEQPIHLVKTSAGSLHYFDFYGLRNDGRVDSLMYRDPFSGLPALGDVQPQKEINLFIDTSAYFLTWAGQNGLRYTTYHNQDYTNYLPAHSYPFRSVMEFHPADNPFLTRFSLGSGPVYSTRHRLNVDYTIGEGFLGPPFSEGGPNSLQLPTPQADTTSPSDATLSVRILGYSDSVHTMQIELPQLGINSPLIYRYGIQIDNHLLTLPQITLPPTTTLKFHAYAHQESNAICQVSMRYHRYCDLNGQSATQIDQWPGSQMTYFAFEHTTGSDSVFGYSLKNQLRISGLIDTTTEIAHLLVPPLTTSDDLLITADQGLLSPVIQAGHRLANLCDPSHRGDFLIITHRSLAASAMAYATYRDSLSSHPMEARIVFTDEIYDEFGYGSITPFAIKRFIKCALDHWENPPQYVLLWGKAKFFWQTRTGQTPALVPTMGYPISDFGFVSNFEPGSGDALPAAAIGRLNIENDAEGMVYLEKVREYESDSLPGQQRAIFLGGGVLPHEHTLIDSMMNRYQASFAQSPLQGTSFYYQIQDTVVVSSTALNYGAALEKDIAVQLFMGHSTSRISDIQLVSDSTIYSAPSFYNNQQKYPLLISMGAYLGDPTNISKSLSEDWLLEPAGGAIGVLASGSGMGIDSIFSIWGTYTHYLTQQLFYESRHEPIGKIVMETLRAIQDSVSRQSVWNTALQVNLQGDPAIRMKWRAALTSLDPASVAITPRIFPNPAQEELVIEYPLPLPDKPHFQLLDGLGRPVAIQPVSSASPTVRTTIPISHLPPGIYYLSVRIAGRAALGYPVQIMRP